MRSPACLSFELERERKQCFKARQVPLACARAATDDLQVMRSGSHLHGVRLSMYTSPSDNRSVLHSSRSGSLELSDCPTVNNLRWRSLSSKPGEGVEMIRVMHYGDRAEEYNFSTSVGAKVSAASVYEGPGRTRACSGSEANVSVWPFSCPKAARTSQSGRCGCHVHMAKEGPALQSAASLTTWHQHARTESAAYNGCQELRQHPSSMQQRSAAACRSRPVSAHSCSWHAHEQRAQRWDRADHLFLLYRSDPSSGRS